MEKVCNFFSISGDIDIILLNNVGAILTEA